MECKVKQHSHPVGFFTNSNNFASAKVKVDEVEHIMNYQNRGLCYLPKPKASADNTDTS